MPTSNSRFVWFDLMTPDANASTRFYTQLFGWSTVPSKDGPYLHLQAGDKMFGGIQPMQPGQHMPSHWMGYLSVENVDAVCDRGVSLGGKVLMPAMNLENVGRFGVLADGQGAVTAPFRSSHPDDAPPSRPHPGTICWSELMTNDTKSAGNFYKTLFAWATHEVDMGQMGVYTLFLRAPGDQSSQVAGMMQMEKNAPYPPFWLHYVDTKDVDATARRATEMGASIYVPPTDIPNIGRFAVLGDPLGATFGLFRMG